MISMTWPQYRRRQCAIGEFVIQLSRIETELLFALLVRYPQPITLGELVEFIYPNPDMEPEAAETAVVQRMHKLARKVGAFRIVTNGRYRGYSLCQRPEDVRLAA